MPEYALGPEAENDLLEIARYTARTWGPEQAERYLAQLEEHFGGLAAGTVFERIVFEHRSDLRVTRCRHHFVFFARAAAGVLILAVFHERMDLMVRLRDRLETTESSG